MLLADTERTEVLTADSIVQPDLSEEILHSLLEERFSSLYDSLDETLANYGQHFDPIQSLLTNLLPCIAHRVDPGADIEAATCNISNASQAAEAATGPVTPSSGKKRGKK